MFRVFFGVILIMTSMMQVAVACGSNTPAQLEERAQNHFKRWDVNHDQVFQIEEFLASDGYNLGAGANESAWVDYIKEKLSLMDAFKQADADHSGGLTYQEWIVIRPTIKRFMLRKGC